MANEIHRDLPEFTVHDITHLDALWEIADIVASEAYDLTPPEAFVLGGAFLLHDLGMTLAAYPQGLEELKKRKTWNDTIAFLFMEKHNRQPTAVELASPSPEAIAAATTYLLRSLHAEQAERIGLASWAFPDSDSPQYLIEDTDIRQTFGRIVGLVAHSHWWPVLELEQRFPRMLGSPHWCPKEWTIDPLKLACLLRLADAGHVDARRAPYFLRTIRRISEASMNHWAFQQRIGKPHLSGDAISYTSGYAFPFEESSSWWLCFDTLRMIDEEFRAVDALLADKGMHRFAARRVAGIESPMRLTSYIPTAGWTPVDASVQVSDVPRLLICLGGHELYGRNIRVPLRELIQNASDALRARWAIEGRPEGWGQVSVRLGMDGNKHWLEVEDNGIGMSPTVLTKYLLDFSTTFWGSSAMIDELPGLLGSGFRPTGKYGIGFFSVFMLGDSVKIRTRRADAAHKDTLVLEFNTGLSSRPVLREAADDEILRDGGTCIRVWLRTPPAENGGLLNYTGGNAQISLAQLCREVCPALPVSLVSHEDDTTTNVIIANDWLNCPGEELLRRTDNWKMRNVAKDNDASKETFARVAKNLRILRDSDGTPIGRACIATSSWRCPERFALGGAITIGGLTACSLNCIAGVLTGISDRAARDSATPLVSFKTLSAWATEQASLIPSLYENLDDQMDCASIVRRCGGQTLGLPVAKKAGSYLCVDQIASMSLSDEVVLLSPYRVSEFEQLDGFEYVDNVFITEYSGWIAIIQSSSYQNWPNSLFSSSGWPLSIMLAGSIIEVVAQTWGVSSEKLLQRAEDQSEREKKRVIGYFNSQEIRSTVLVLNRTQAVRERE